MKKIVFGATAKKRPLPVTPPRSPSVSSESEGEKQEREREERRKRFATEEERLLGAASPAEVGLSADEVALAEDRDVVVDMEKALLNPAEPVHEPEMGGAAAPAAATAQSVVASTHAIMLENRNAGGAVQSGKRVVDIFSDSPGAEEEGMLSSRNAMNPILAEVNDELIDDSEGYINLRIGDVLHSRYVVEEVKGKGVFSSVVRARDKNSEGEARDVAIKVIRSKDAMAKAGLKEVEVLNLLNDRDPKDRMHIVRLHTHFEWRGHLCLVFEPLSMNLRDVLKKFGRTSGLNINGLRVFARQLLMALLHMKKCGVIHADLKPDNVCVDEKFCTLKVVDLGSACRANEENPPTPYLVSRFYRAPEITLGLKYEYAVDMWSVGCLLYELYTSRVLFPGKDNNDMLRLHMELKGKISNKILKKSLFRERYFDEEYRFVYRVKERESERERERVRVIAEVKVVESLQDKLKVEQGVSNELKVRIERFIDFLDKALELDASRRLTPEAGLAHPFITQV